jgi:SAM-dependent MidA family methyltransferase
MNPLELIIRDEISTAGPMRFDRFMELALYHPQHGYYAAPSKIGREGDFFTSVSVGPLFGRMIARQARQMADLLDEPVFWIVEQGAHDGRLAHDILEEARSMAALFSRLRYLIIEPSTAAMEAQRKALGEFESKVEWCAAPDQWSGERPAGLFLSNELVDAFPVRLVQRGSEEWRERHVMADGDGALVWCATAALDDELRDAIRQLGLPEPPQPAPYSTEINLAARRWMQDITGFMRRGYIVTIDYGYPASVYYAPFRSEGTLTCYQEHRKGRNVLAEPGAHDITAHVDFTALVSVGEKAGWQPLALVDQQRFLTGIAHDELAGTAVYSPDLAGQLQAWRTLTDPGFLGSQFQVLIQAKDAPGGLDGLRFARAGGWE